MIQQKIVLTSSPEDRQPNSIILDNNFHDISEFWSKRAERVKVILKYKYGIIGKPFLLVEPDPFALHLYIKAKSMLSFGAL